MLTFGVMVKEAGVLVQVRLLGLKNWYLSCGFDGGW